MTRKEKNIFQVKMKTLNLTLTTKNLAIFFGLATTAFCVSTIILAVEKSSLEEELQDALHKLEAISTLTTAATTPTTSTTSSSLPESSTEETTTDASLNSTEISTSTEFPSPSFPTLPPGLPDPEQIIHHLPTDIRPIKYKLYIHPDMKSKTSEGSVSIQIEIDKKTNLIVLHAKDLDINSMSILNMIARIRIRIRKFYLDVKREMLFIELEEILFTKTPYVVSINYNCRMDGLSGMYASSYADAGSERR